MLTKRKTIKRIAVFLTVNMLLQVFMPTVSYALTSGPSQPEFSSFEPVATTNMVNAFTGDFTYNLPVLEVPGPHGSGYPISLSYHSGGIAEEESSWVGYGWSLNAGAINRSTRGFPDDYNGEPVTYHSKTPKNWTVTAGARAATEIFGNSNAINLSVSTSIRYNNYRGFGQSTNIGVTLAKGFVSLGYGLNDGDNSFSLQISPAALMEQPDKENKKVTKRMTDKQKKEAYDKNFKNNTLRTVANNGNLSLLGSSYGILSLGEGEKPSMVPAYSGKAYNVSVRLEANGAPVPIGPFGSVYGSYSEQENVPSTTTNAFGYMYSARATKDGMMDYHVEKESNYNKRDKFLGVPFNDADIFMAAGEGISGSFRMYQKNLGYFGPRNLENDPIEILSVDPQVHLGTAPGVGASIGVGNQKLSIGDWDREVGEFYLPTNTDVDEPVFFRFNGDPGGSWGDHIVDAPERARPGNTPEIGGFNYDISAGERSGRSSYIGYNTNADMKRKTGDVYYKAYSKTHSLIEDVNRPDNAIGEFAVTNESGNQYVYALPVKNRNEKSFSYGVGGAQPGDIEENYIIKHKNDEVLQGTETNGEYASSYLLTQITTPDYVDLHQDGPTPDDFGGYTKFNYDKQYGEGETSWYKWRNPYYGLMYQRGSLSDKKDDIGAVSHGEKEVYYLSSIETKTHIAVFDTDSKARDGDGFAANTSESAAIDGNGDLTNGLKRLNRILLFPRSALKSGAVVPYVESDFEGNPIKTVHLKYADQGEELMVGAPNNVSGRGKLTLQKVYFEYNGITTTRIRPYIFGYEYPSGLYPSKYSDLDNYANGLEENPPYSVHNSDAWGYYQKDGAMLHDDMKTWVNQSYVDREFEDSTDPANDPDKLFDPAVWNLKTITLPSGGQIHVQYEADDYNYVQDQEAHIMMPLVDEGDGHTFRLDHTEVGLKASHLDDLVAMIKRRYENTDKKIYFKFLYRLKGEGEVNLDKCNIEYITGYADVTNVVKQNGYVHITLDNNDSMPDEVCQDFVQHNRLGMLNGNDDCNVEDVGLNNKASARDLVMNLLNYGEARLNPASLCKVKSPELSYFRVPTPAPKRGGGLRVKRLMTFAHSMDGGLTPNELYGNEYIYKTISDDGRLISSGVATNEPSAMREENILIDFIKRKGQKPLNRIIYGKDKKQSEGPIGESILPGPSVGYSKVITKNIHDGFTTTGYNVSEFHTAKDYPIRVEMTGIDNSRRKHDIIFTVVYNEFTDHQYATQGFSFILNNMHGQPERSATYPGHYVDLETTNITTPVTEQITEYYEPGEEVPMVKDMYGDVEWKRPGREVDVTFAQKKVEESMFDASVEVDFTLGIYVFFVIPFATAWPTVTETDGKLYTHTTTKVINYPAYQKRTRVYQDGIYHTTENVAFNEYNGQPVSVKNYDEFNGAYLAQQVPATWEYDNFKPIAQNERKVVKGSFDFDGTRLTLSDVCDLGSFVEGDLLQLNDARSFYHVKGIDYATRSLSLIPSFTNTSTPGTVTQLEVLRSGNNNQLTTSVGEITFHDVEGFISPVDQEFELPRIDETNRYDSETGGFAEALEGALSSGEGVFTLAGPFDNVDMTGFAGLIGDACVADLSNVSIQQVGGQVIDDGISLRVQIMAFSIACDSGLERFAAEGWE
ncbi:MAG: hypothetical protein AAFX87_20645 [Bacteroidota bacterium]